METRRHFSLYLSFGYNKSLKPNLRFRSGYEPRSWLKIYKFTTVWITLSSALSAKLSFFFWLIVLEKERQVSFVERESDKYKYIHNYMEREMEAFGIVKAETIFKVWSPLKESLKVSSHSPNNPKLFSGHSLTSKV